MLALQETVSEVLGIHAPDPQELMSAVEHGLPLSSLDRVGFVVPMDAKFTYRLVARASLARRRKQDRLSSDEGARLARLASVWAFAVEVWGGAEAARRFMFEPHSIVQQTRKGLFSFIKPAQPPRFSRQPYRQKFGLLISLENFERWKISPIAVYRN